MLYLFLSMRFKSGSFWPLKKKLEELTAPTYFRIVLALKVEARRANPWSTEGYTATISFRILLAFKLEARRPIAQTHEGLYCTNFLQDFVNTRKSSDSWLIKIETLKAVFFVLSAGFPKTYEPHSKFLNDPKNYGRPLKKLRTLNSLF